MSKPFWVIVHKETADILRSWRFIILLALVLLTCAGSLYTSVTNIKPGGAFLFLKLFTSTDGSLPSYIVFIGFLGPLLGICLGFDAINAEWNRRTLGRVLSQPIHRDTLLNAKFTAALLVIGALFFALTLLVAGLGLFIIGVPPSATEFMRLICFTVVSIVYVAFWLNLSMLFSVRFRQAATSALVCIAAWLFLTVFYPILVNLVAKSLVPSPYDVIGYQHIVLTLMRFAPSQLFNDATATLLMPTVRTLGPVTMEQVSGALPNPLSLGQSLLIAWPQLTGLAAATIGCFALSYFSFMRKEIRT